VQPLLDWVTSLPVAAVYAVLAVFAFLENVFPPVPADTVVAFGSFLAARGEGSLLGAAASTWLGNIAGAMFMYWVGRRYGAHRLEQRMLGKNAGAAEARLHALYGKYGLGALFVSRFLPGVRAIVPPFAGALRIPPIRAALMMGIASAIWYGMIALLAYHIGADWEALTAAMQRYGRYLAIGAAAIALVAAGVWWYRRRRRGEA
jgi:membrane protein DedA with SNARE-associated domain